MRNVLARVPKGNAEMVAAAIRTIFAQPDAEHVRSQLDVIAGTLGRQFPQVETMLREAARICWPSPAFRSVTGRRSGQPIRWSG
jgi:transposase-like protein